MTETPDMYLIVTNQPTILCYYRTIEKISRVKCDVDSNVDFFKAIKIEHERLQKKYPNHSIEEKPKLNRLEEEFIEQKSSSGIRASRILDSDPGRIDDYINSLPDSYREDLTFRSELQELVESNKGNSLYWTLPELTTVIAHRRLTRPRKSILMIPYEGEEPWETMQRYRVCRALGVDIDACNEDRLKRMQEQD